MSKTQKLFASFFLAAFIGTAFFANSQALAQEDLTTDDGVVCGTNVCVVDEAKNRFLARGCKTKPDFDCVVGGPGLPSVG